LAKISINDKIQHEIDSNIYGHFIEEVGECIHDGIWAYSDNVKRLPMVDDNKLDHVRQDLFDAEKDLFQNKNNRKTFFTMARRLFCRYLSLANGTGPRERRPVKK